MPTCEADSVAARLDGVRRRIADAAARVGRSPRSVTLVAVSKLFSAEHVRWAQRAGQADFGESHAQELKRKALVAQGVRWHFVGRLQGNKVRDVVGLTGLIHSVDRTELAQAIAERAWRTRRIQQVLVQVNLGGDPAKGGCDPDGVFALLTAIRQLDGIACQGLMTIPPLGSDPRPVFRRLARFRDQARTVWPEVQHLSMGMSGDFEVAVEEGATIVRLGEAVFGPRPGGRGESPQMPGGRGESPQMPGGRGESPNAGVPEPE
ncbi:MAG: YggS family pyridoxal phosphate-dependent enzyme [Pseudonocardiaceae bacterium]